jgi:hypothetical protein
MAKRRRKKQYYTDPITGRKKEVGAVYNPITGRKIPKGHYEEPITGNLRRVSKRKSYQSYNKPKRKNYSSYNRGPDIRLEDIDPKVWIFLLVIGVIFMIYWYIIRPFVNWIKDNTVTALIIGVIIVVVGIIAIVFYVKWRIKKRKEKEIFDKEQIDKGLIKFVDRFRNERWGKPNEVQRWTKEDEEAKENEKKINRVIEEIDNFEPLRKYKNEYPYQIELAGFLKSKFPGVDIEKQKGSSRPDIVVEDIAIEIKGPTRHRDLDTVMSKCARYKQHFGEIVIVLFEVEVNDRYYDEWKKGLDDTFPNVKIIKK